MIHLKFLTDEDFVNYKLPSMFIGSPRCTFKCDKEAGTSICQNSSLAKEPIIGIHTDHIVQRYIDNPITKAVVIGGLEPLDTLDELRELISSFRKVTNDDIVVYTGYYPEEVPEAIKLFKEMQNIFVKYGRFIPDQPHRFDKLLGIELSSDNQYCIWYIGNKEVDSRDNT